MRRRTHTRKGFNLIEAAIVLGVVGFVIGGIWYAAAGFNENRLANKTVADVFYIAQGLQSKLSAADAAQIPAWSQIGSYAIAADIYPKDWIQNGIAISPYGTTSGITNTGGSFDFYFRVKTHSQCIRLLNAFHARSKNSFYGLSGVAYLQTATNGTNLMDIAVSDSDCAAANEQVIVTFQSTQHN